MIRDPLNEKIAEQLMFTTGSNLDEQIAGPTSILAQHTVGGGAW